MCSCDLIPRSRRAPDEQAEAIGLLRLRYPAVINSLLSDIARSAAMALSPQGPPPPTSASCRTSSPAAPPPLPPPPPPPPLPPSRHTWSSSVLFGTPEAVPLDDRIAHLYYGRGLGQRPSSGSKGREAIQRRCCSPRQTSSAASPRSAAQTAHVPQASPGSRSSAGLRQRRESSPAERSASRLHNAGTISSTISTSLRGSVGVRAEGMIMLDGRADAKALNNFAFQLRRAPGSTTASSSTLDTLAAAVGPSSSTSPGQGGTRRSPGRDAGVNTQLASSPSSLTRPKSPPQSVGSREAPSSDVAFGSARVQRPDASTLTSTLQIPRSRTGEVAGIF